MDGDSIWAGDKRLPISGYGDVDIQVRKTDGQERILRLFDVACCKRLVCNLVSLRQLRKRGFYWDTKPTMTMLRRSDGTELCAVPEKEGQFVLEYIPIGLDNAAFAIRRNKFNSWTRRRPRLVNVRTWHLRLGHPGPGALNHLVNAADGVRISGIPQKKRNNKKTQPELQPQPQPAPQPAEEQDPVNKPREDTEESCQAGDDCPANAQPTSDQNNPPTTAQCDPCALAKMKRQVRRTQRDITRYKPGECLALDFHDFEIDYMGYSTLLLISDRPTGYMWDYYLPPKRKTGDILTALKDFIPMMERQYSIKVKAVECDNEITERFPGIKQWLESQHIKTEPSPAHTQGLNGAAERSGGMVKNAIRAMAIGAKFPHNLWREISKTAVYLLNRTPRKRLQ